jgi:hypothetical protein
MTGKKQIREVLIELRDEAKALMEKAAKFEEKDELDAALLLYCEAMGLARSIRIAGEYLHENVPALAPLAERAMARGAELWNRAARKRQELVDLLMEAVAEATDGSSSDAVIPPNGAGAAPSPAGAEATLPAGEAGVSEEEA